MRDRQTDEIDRLTEKQIEGEGQTEAKTDERHKEEERWTDEQKETRRDLEIVTEKLIRCSGRWRERRGDREKKE